MANQYKNKVIYGNQTLMDITDTTATENDVLEGEIFYSANGAKSTGTLGDATTTTHGLMSATDKTKLDGVETGAQVNPGNATTSTAGLMSAADKTKLDGIATGATANVGTITGIKMNGASKGTSGVVDLGTVITAHQDISGKADKSSTVSNVAYDSTNKKITKTINGTTSDIVTAATLKTAMSLGNVENKSSATIRGEITNSNVTTALGFTPMDASLKGVNNGVAELDSAGKVPASQLPAYVDDVLEYDKQSSFPTTGETGKIYVAQDTNKTYRWSGTAYVEISPSLALGETSSTAYRGDRGKAAYDHALAKGSAFASGLYKITTNSEGHVTAATAVAKADITGLGIPGSDTNTHRPIQVNGTEVLGNNTTALNLKAGSNVSITNSSGTITIDATDTTYSSKAAASGGTDVSLVTTGEKAIWNAKTSNTGTVTSVAASGSGGITISGSPVTTSGTISVGLNLNTAINGLSTGDSVPADNDYVITQYVNGGTTTTTYHRRPISKIWDYIKSKITKTVVTDALGYTPPTTDTNTWRPVSDSVSSTSSSDCASSKAVKTAYDLANGKVSCTTANVKSALGTGSGTSKYLREDGSWGTPPDNNTHRPIQVNGTEILGNNTTALNLKAGSNVSITNSSGTVTIAATDTTYSSKSAASDGTDVSLVTTGEKYTWNNKSNLTIGTSSTTAAAGNHTHGLSMATSSGTNAITLAASTKYQLTAGGSTYIFTTPPNTTYSVATTSANGLMSSDDKTKLNGIATGAEVNQNAFSNVAVGNTTVSADSKTDTLTLVAGSNVTLTPDATNDKITIAATDTNTWRPVSDSVSSTSSSDAASSKAVKTAYDLANGKVSCTTANVKTALGTGSGTSKYLREDGSWATPSDTNTHRPIQVNGTEILGNNTTALNLKAGSNVSITNSSGTVTIAATNTTYESKSAASGGTDVSLVTTGEKYTWNNKSNLAIGTTASTAMAGNTTVTNVAISANTTTNANYPVVFATSNTGTTAAKNEGVQKSGAKFYFNPSTGNVVSTTFNGYTLGAACAKGVTDNTSATAVTSSDTNLITGRTLYNAGYTKLTLGTTSTTAAAGNHSHDAYTVATSSANGTKGMVPAPPNFSAVLTSMRGWSQIIQPETITLTAGSWSSSTPPTQTVFSYFASATNTIVIGVDGSTTAEQLEALSAAKIVCTAQAAQSLTFTCYGTEPTINIPISCISLNY